MSHHAWLSYLMSLFHPFAVIEHGNQKQLGEEAVDLAHPSITVHHSKELGQELK